MSHTDTARVRADALGGGVWPTRQDKMTLEAIGATVKPWPHNRLEWDNRKTVRRNG
ncbi:MAG: hypothetical protein WAO15_06360 [Mycobacterium sp.]